MSGHLQPSFPSSIPFCTQFVRCSFFGLFSGENRGEKESILEKKKAFSFSTSPFPVIFRSKNDARKSHFHHFAPFFKNPSNFPPDFAHLESKNPLYRPKKCDFGGQKRTKTNEKITIQIRCHVDNEDKLTRQFVVSGQRQRVIFINDSSPIICFFS